MLMGFLTAAWHQRHSRSLHPLSRAILFPSCLRFLVFALGASARFVWLSAHGVAQSHKLPLRVASLPLGASALSGSWGWCLVSTSSAPSPPTTGHSRKAFPTTARADASRIPVAELRTRDHGVLRLVPGDGAHSSLPDVRKRLVDEVGEITRPT
ncbi:hypothetical protein OPV22_001808 [Ensete ventricosum]|uniref:Uncharacterized protein n=1 Tax=Ensete ventricosum TaxID=4639 RepID=A0AAV8RWJ3_ENSVE|nr:hypothetical protein OPV22_001808 [Ensete ventricosum]